MDDPTDMDFEALMDDLRNLSQRQDPPTPPTPQPPAHGIPDIFLTDTLSVPDDGQIAAHWTLSHPDIAYGRGKWRRYTDGIWEAVDDELIYRLVRRTCEAARQRKYRVTAARVRSVMELARNDVAVEDDRWDAHPRLLPMRNGLLDLKDHLLLPHQRNVYATSRLDYDYDPEADCPNFRRVLERISDAADFLQEFAGYCLTPDTKLETAVWLQGPPGCGKSSLLEGLIAMLGARVANLGLGDIDSNRFALARVPGKTLLTSSEQPENRIAVTHLLNALISGEPIRVEEKYRQAMEIRPIAKILWAMNHLPRVMQADNGLMRRVKIVVFPGLQAGTQDPDLKHRIKAEAAG
ncbi:MAG: phage/plasmid primase, P4 family, partial [Chloroflexota bacterium]